MHIEIDKNKIKKGLYIVSTPIGNLKDITLRALEILRISDIILCEDTRVSKKLLNAFNINKKLVSNHKFNEKKNIHKLQSILEDEKIISLISDSGTPLISDPGKILVEYCIKKQINIIPIPGPSSVISSISIAGFSNNFYFHGFLPEKINQISKDFLYLSNFPFSIIFFISAKKILKIENQLKQYFFDRKIVICKELTKFYEDVSRYEVKNINFSNLNLKGEITIVLSQPISKKKTEIISESDKIKIKKILKKLSVKDTAELMSNDLKISKSIIYKYCIKIKNEN